MLKLSLAAVIAVSFVSVQAHVQRVKGLSAITPLAAPTQPSAPSPGVSLGLGTTRAIEKDRQIVHLDCGDADRLAFGPLGPELPGPSLKAEAASAAASPPLHLRI